MNKVAISVLTLAGVGALALVWMRRASEPAQAATAEVTRLQAQVADLKHQLGTQRDNSGSPNQIGHRTSPTQAPAPHTVPQTPAEKHEWIKARGLFYTSQIEAEARNEQWATGIEKKARALISQRPAVTAKAVECRSTMCRMDFVYPTRESRQEHLSSVPGSMPELPRVAFEYINGDHGEVVEAVLYFASEGHNLPEFNWQPTGTP